MMAESDANALRTGLNPSGNRVRWYQRKRRVPGTQMSTLQQKRLLSLQLIADDLKAHSGRRQRHNRRDIYQFGVLTGGGMKAWIDAFPTYFGEPFSGELWGFDSFEGMPEEDAALRYDRHKNDPAWLAGGLNAAEHLNLTSWPALRAKLVQNIGHLPAQTHLIRGFFNDSLRGGRGFANELGMRPAFLVDIDADLYTSTREALCFLLDAGILVPGTFVYYDDIGHWEWRVMDSGDRFPLRNATSQEIMWKNITHLEERLAHDEVTRIYGLQWRLLTRNLTVVHEPDPALSWIWQSKRPTWPGSCSFGPVDEIPPPKRNISVDHQKQNSTCWNGTAWVVQPPQPVLQLIGCERCLSPHRLGLSFAP